VPLSGLYVFNEFPDPLGRQGIRYSRNHPSIALNLLIEFDALVTRGRHRICTSVSVSSDMRPEKRNRSFDSGPPQK